MATFKYLVTLNDGLRIKTTEIHLNEPSPGFLQYKVVELFADQHSKRSAQQIAVPFSSVKYVEHIKPVNLNSLTKRTNIPKDIMDDLIKYNLFKREEPVVAE